MQRTERTCSRGPSPQGLDAVLHGIIWVVVVADTVAFFLVARIGIGRGRWSNGWSECRLRWSTGRRSEGQDASLDTIVVLLFLFEVGVCPVAGCRRNCRRRFQSPDAGLDAVFLLLCDGDCVCHEGVWPRGGRGSLQGLDAGLDTVRLIVLVSVVRVIRWIGVGGTVTFGKGRRLSQGGPRSIRAFDVPCTAGGKPNGCVGRKETGVDPFQELCPSERPLHATGRVAVVPPDTGRRRRVRCRHSRPIGNNHNVRSGVG